MPIRIRLALWHGAIFGVALTLLGLLLYILMARHLNGMVDDTIDSRIEHVRVSIQSHAPGGPLSIPALDTFESSDVFVQVFYPDGSLAARSSNLGQQTLPLPESGLRRAVFPVTLGGTNLKAEIAPIMQGGQPIAWVEVAASYRERDLVLDWLRRALVAGGLAGTALVGLISASLAGNALRPVAEMTETAQAIALSRGFSRRLRASDPRDELGRLAQTFNDMLASLEAAYATQQRFTSDASHELRAPLTAIRGNLDLLERVQDMPDEERQATLLQVRREVERLSRLVADLLTLARADEGQPLQAGPVELDALVIKAHARARALADGVVVRVGAIVPVVVQGNEDRLDQLLLILTDNAVRYTPRGGTVILSLRREPPWAIVDVEDTGIGIEPEDLPHIFERFWRADRARSRDRGGTGLGLAIARWIVERHGGEIRVSSTPGKGSRFSVRLPLSP